jgi:GAF domain-containing protein
VSTFDASDSAIRAFDRRLELERLLADISSRFINASPDALDREIEAALRTVCEPLGVEQAILWQWSTTDVGVVAPTHAYAVREELRPGEAPRQEQYPWAVAEVAAGRPVVLPSMDSIPDEGAHDRENARRFGLESSLILPLAVGVEPPVGALAFNALSAERDWSEHLVSRLRLGAEVFANALARRRSEQALRQSEEINRATFEQAAVGIADVAPDRRFLRVNDRLCTIAEV